VRAIAAWAELLVSRQNRHALNGGPQRAPTRAGVRRRRAVSDAGRRRRLNAAINTPSLTSRARLSLQWRCRTSGSFARHAPPRGPCLAEAGGAPSLSPTSRSAQKTDSKICNPKNFFFCNFFYLLYRMAYVLNLFWKSCRTLIQLQVIHLFSENTKTFSLEKCGLIVCPARDWLT
jgi:hypothetical protein